MHLTEEILAPIRARYGEPRVLEWTGEISEGEWEVATYDPQRTHDVTLFILVEIIGWSLIVWGILDLLSAFATYGMRHWWLYLIRGFASIALGFLALGRENVTLYFVVTLLAAFVIIWGVGDILIAFMLHGAKAKWEREQRAIRRPSSNAGSRPAKKAPARKAAPARKTAPVRKTTSRTPAKRR